MSEINYLKSRKIDLEHLEKQYWKIQKSQYPDLKTTVNPFHIDKLQNYNPIYSLFFEMTPKNYNSISLNHPKHFIDLNTVYNETLQIKLPNTPVYIKYAPLLDPIHYLIGKYDKDKIKLNVLPNLEMSNETHLEKITSPYNSAYIDCFFSYLSGQLLSNHGFIHSIEFYGSYLGIQKKFRMDITDDYEYLQQSKFFLSNKNQLYELESSSPEINKPKLIFGEECEFEADVLDDEIMGDVLLPEDLELIYQNADANVYKNNDDSSSSSSASNSQVNDSSQEDDSSESEENLEECETDSIPESNTEWSDMEDDPEVIAYIYNFPIQMICSEKCEGTFDYLLENNLLDEPQIASAFFQIVMTLAAYQRAYSFTHNDLHTNNIVYTTTSAKFIEYRFLQKTYLVPTFGKIYKIIDFGRAIYRFQDKILCSDSFASGGDANSQYNIEPFMNTKKPRLEPNPSFDLCRLGCSLYDFVFDNEDEEIIRENESTWSEIQKTVYRWCTDDNGKNILYKRSGEERYPDFKLYKMIARIVHKHTIENQMQYTLFSQYEQTGKEKKKRGEKIVVNIDIIPKCYTALST
jgi:hypothetical protein